MCSGFDNFFFLFRIKITKKLLELKARNEDYPCVYDRKIARARKEGEKEKERTF